MEEYEENFSIFEIGDKVALLECDMNRHLKRHYGAVFTVVELEDDFDRTIKVAKEGGNVYDWYFYRFYKLQNQTISLIEISEEYKDIFV